MIQQVYKLIWRVGLSEDNKKKAIKFVLRNKQDKKKIVNNLRNLKRK